MTVTRDTHLPAWQVSGLGTPTIPQKPVSNPPSAALAVTPPVATGADREVAEPGEPAGVPVVESRFSRYRSSLVVGERMGLMLVAGDLLACLLPAAFINAGTQSTVGTALVMVGLLAMGGLNRSRLSLSVLDDLPQIIRLWLVGAGFLIVVSELITGNLQLTLFLGVLPAIVLVRTVLYGLIRSWRARGWVTHPTIVVGAGSLGQMVVDALHRHPETGLRTFGFIDSRPLDAEELPIPLIGEPSELTDVLVKSKARAIVVAHGGMDDSDLVTLVRKCQRQQCEVFVLPRLPEITHVGSDMDNIGDMPLIRLRRSAYRSPSWRIKRLMDIAASAAAIVVLAPLLALVALAVRLETGRGVIFRQERIGRDGIAFELMKFRSLKPVDDAESQTNWNISHDSRVGPVGRFLRKTSIDELPQLFNILRGDMSLVGPRPLIEHEDAQVEGRFRRRLDLTPGLTGLWQVHGRSEIPFEQMVNLDYLYVSSWSLFNDFKILLKTVPAVFGRRGAY